MAGPAVGLRERKKNERRKLILLCSRQLFARDGFDATSVEAIAGAVDVAVGTIYKFFPAKIDMLSALLREDLEANLSSLPPITVDSHASPQAGIHCLLAQVFRALESLPKSDLSRITAHALATGQATQTGQLYAGTDDYLRDAIEALLSAYQVTGALASNIDKNTLSGLIFSVANGEHLAWLTGKYLSFEQVLQRQAQFLDIIFAGAATLATATAEEPWLAAKQQSSASSGQNP